MVEGIFTYPDIAKATGVARGTLYMWVARGKMPRPDYHFGRTPVWAADTIQPWIQAHNGKKEDTK